MAPSLAAALAGAPGPRRCAPWSPVHPPARTPLLCRRPRQDAGRGADRQLRHDPAARPVRRDLACRRSSRSASSDLPLEVLGHEVGHHVLCPADLADDGRHARPDAPGTARSSSTRPVVANLYADLLINDRLQRATGLRMAEVYRAIGARRRHRATPLWTLYLRTVRDPVGAARGHARGGRRPAPHRGRRQLGRAAGAGRTPPAGSTGRAASRRCASRYLIDDGAQRAARALRRLAARCRRHRGRSRRPAGLTERRRRRAARAPGARPARIGEPGRHRTAPPADPGSTGTEAGGAVTASRSSTAQLLRAARPAS